MSPSTNSTTGPPSPAYSQANFASIFAVLTTFSSVIPSSIQEPEELDAIIQCAADDTAPLKALALALLAAATDRRNKAPPAEEHWSKACSSLAAGSAVSILRGLQVPEEAADSLDAFAAQPLAVRVDMLYWLCEIALMSNSAIKALVDREYEAARKPSLKDAASDEKYLRLEPLAECGKQRYWLFGSKTRQLYLETLSQKGKGRLELLASTPEEFAAVVEDLRSQRTHALKDIAETIAQDVIPFLERQAKKRERVERAQQRHALAMANVHLYETRTRKRQRVNYNVDETEVFDF
ncbi:hypothetical protein GGI15_004122 [Coemansia interrupta]|uniref:Uncharacterized protein n=1 Tax=Coemansia interrupta TaxID=1126814 RepID=A0A9W8H442_9FUNG|nr:hypothetical protein GGI15_004122 [Coemansia interrupta]